MTIEGVCLAHDLVGRQYYNEDDITERLFLSEVVQFM